MKSMKLWTAVLLAGMAMLVVYPYLPQSAQPLNTGVFPELLLPIAYAIAGIGATGLFLAWVWKREARSG